MLGVEVRVLRRRLGLLLLYVLLCHFYSIVRLSTTAWLSIWSLWLLRRVASLLLILKVLGFRNELLEFIKNFTANSNVDGRLVLVVVREEVGIARE